MRQGPGNHSQNATGIIVSKEPQRTIRSFAHVTNAFMQTLKQPLFPDQAVAVAFKSRHELVFKRTAK